MAMGILLLSLLVIVLTVGLGIIYALPPQSRVQKKRVQIIVLGDIGRSPRMQYHALSIVQHGGRVDFVGYLDSDPITELRPNSSVKFFPLSQPPSSLQSQNPLVFALSGPLKVLFQIWNLWKVMAYETATPEWVLVQNPPSIPTLALAVIICYLRGSKLVIDWHNFGYSILALKLGDGHPLVKVSKIYEQFLGRFAHSNLAVTNAMCEVLKSDFKITRPLLPLHDRPAPIFAPLTMSEKIEFLTRSELTAAEANDILDKRVRLVVSSTSWTADEDFSVLLNALRSYSASATSDSPHLPELLVIITGKGPLQDHYLNEIHQLNAKQELEMVSIKTAWLSFEDYAALLGAADLGVSLHTSSSGVDLPMKVVDMFGAGLPVVGFGDFKAWSELVVEDVNGKGFSTSDQMASILSLLFEPGNKNLETLRQGATYESKRRWASEWDPVAGRMLGFSRLKPQR